jgi:hypothetical protein
MIRECQVSRPDPASGQRPDSHERGAIHRAFKTDGARGHGKPCPYGDAGGGFLTRLYGFGLGACRGAKPLCVSSFPQDWGSGG